MSNNHGTKRTAPSDDGDDQNDESASAERNNRSRRSPTFQLKPGPASWKRSFLTQPNASRSSLGSSSQKPGSISSKTASTVDKKRTANSPETTFQRLRNDAKESKIEIGDNNSEFIWLVRKFPHLYNPKDPFHRDLLRKDKSWTAISVICGMTADDCRVKWKLLRDRYCRERKKKPEHVAADFRHLMKTELKFLDSVIQFRRTIGIPTSSSRRSSVDEEQTLPPISNDSNPPTQTVPRDDQDSRASCPKQVRRDKQARIIMSSKTSKNATTPSPTTRRAQHHSTSLDSRLRTEPNSRNTVSNSSGHDGSATEEENEEDEEEEEEEEEEGEETEKEEEEEEEEEDDEEDGDDGNNEVNGVQSKANGKSTRQSDGALNNAISTLSRIKRTRTKIQDSDQLFADTLAVIFRQFKPSDKNLILSKFLRYIVKMQRKKKRL